MANTRLAKKNQYEDNLPIVWREDKYNGRGGMKICFIIFNDYVTNLVSSTAVREDSSAFAFRHTDMASENPTASRVPTVGNERALVALGGL